MAYTPTLWAKGDKVTSEKLNKIEQGIVNKVDKENGKTLSTNDFTDAYKTKLDGIDANADKTTIDATLTNSGAAADAKATGDAIKDIENDLDGKIATIESNLDEEIENLRSLVGTPLKATTASDMTDTSKIYVYTGNESGYTNGDWYYHDGSAWVDGGTYNSVAVEVDKTLTVDGMPADAKVVGDEIGSIKEDFTDVDNELFYAQDILPKAITTNHYLKGTGVAGTSTTSDIYKYAVTAGEKIHIKASKDNDGVYQWQNSESVSYSSTSAVIGDPVNVAADSDVVVPTGATYLMVSQLKTNTTNRVYRKLSVIDGIKSDILSIHIMSARATPTVENSRVMHGGTIESSQTSDRTEFITIPDGCDTVRFKASGYSTVDIVSFFDASNVYISGIEAINEEIEATASIPSTAKKVILSSTKVVTDAYIYIYSSQSVLDKMEKVYNNAWNITNRNVLIFGDSITDCCTVTVNASNETTEYKFRNPSNHYTDENDDVVYYDQWPKILNDICIPKECRNYALSGASYKHQDNTRLSLDVQMEIAINDLDNPNGVFSEDEFVPDIIVFALGTNDGNPNDTPESAYNKIVTTSTGIDVDATLSILDKSKYCEAVLYAYMTARKYFPLAMIFCSTPLQRMSSNDPLGNERTYLMEIAKRYGGAIIIDSCYDSGIVKQNNVLGGLGITLKDGLHPNEKGQNLIARTIISSINRHYMPFDLMNQ